MRTVPMNAVGAIPRLVCLLAVVAAAGGVAPSYADNVTRTNTATRTARIGEASWYGPGFHGRRTASGVRFDQNAMTAAHRTLPLGTQVRVTNLRTGRTVLVTINDRGPYRGRRVLDLSKGAAREIGLISRGVERVLIEPLI